MRKALLETGVIQMEMGLPRSQRVRLGPNSLARRLGKFSRSCVRVSVVGSARAGQVEWLWEVPNGQEFFQLELFQFSPPARRPPPGEASDVGISRAGVFVADFPGAVRRLAALGHAPIAGVRTFPGHGARVAFRDPAGSVVELMDTDPVPGARPAAVAVRTVTLTVPAS